MRNRLTLFFCSFAFTLTSIATVNAQDILEQIYGAGVHALYAGHPDQARELFDEVINAGSQDPRAYYFRGLAEIQSQCGLVEAGMADFDQAAQLEVSSRTSANVSRALQRIQGPTRLAIERARAKARLSARTLQFEAARERYGDPNAPQAVPPVVPPAAPAVNPPAANDPFAEGPGLTGGEPAPMPTTPAPPTPDFPALPAEPAMPELSTPPSSDPSPNPFGDEPTPAPSPATDNPFGF